MDKKKSALKNQDRLVGSEGLGPPNPKGSGFTVRRNCRYANSPIVSCL